MGANVGAVCAALTVLQIDLRRHRWAVDCVVTPERLVHVLLNHEELDARAHTKRCSKNSDTFHATSYASVTICKKFDRHWIQQCLEVLRQLSDGRHI